MFKNIPPEMLSMAQAFERAIGRDAELEIDSVQNKARWLKLIKEQNETISSLRAENGRLTAELEEARGLLADLYDLVSDKTQDSIDALFEKMERTTHE